VLGLDLAGPALALAAAKARAEELDNLEFRAGDIQRVAELWRLVRPGGRLAVTVWGPRFMARATPRYGRRSSGRIPTGPARSRPGPE
jgi:hypothetical protein